MITRITGVAAMVGLVATAGLGVLLTMRRLGNYHVKTRMGLHRRLSWMALLGLSVHIGAALLDRSHVPSYAVVAPFLSPVRTIATGTGSLAIWGLIAVMLTAARRRWFKHSWRRIHYVSYPAAGLALTHSLLGSDGILTALAVALCVIVLIVRPIWPRRCTKGPGRANDSSGRRPITTRQVPATIMRLTPRIHGGSASAD